MSRFSWIRASVEAGGSFAVRVSAENTGEHGTYVVAVVKAVRVVRSAGRLIPKERYVALGAKTGFLNPWALYRAISPGMLSQESTGSWWTSILACSLLLRSGRLEVEVELPVPDKKAREEILDVLARDLPLASELCSYRCPRCGVAYSLPGACSECKAELELRPSLAKVAEAANGYVGADLAAVCREAAVLAARSGSSIIKLEHFMEALKLVRPTATREIRTERPRVSWSDIGGLSDVIQQLREAVEWPLKHPEVFRRMGVKPPKGVLLYGPPGTGKTLLAKAAASESGASFIAVKGPELLSKWVGESEKAIREVFRKARQYSPSIVFFDEINALAPRRSDNGSRVSERVVAQLLTEMDGIEELEGVVVMAATNRPDLLDPALLRPGRLDRVIQVPLPDEKGRLEILGIHTREMPLADDVDLAMVARAAHRASGADLKAKCIEAAILALRESLEAREVRVKHFMEAVKKVMASRK